MSESGGHEHVADEVRSSERAVRLRDGLRDSLLVFLGVRIGFSVIGVLTVALIAPREGLPAVSV